jgi:hypothetical protein
MSCLLISLCSFFKGAATPSFRCLNACRYQSDYLSILTGGGIEENTLREVRCANLSTGHVLICVPVVVFLNVRFLLIHAT